MKLSKILFKTFKITNTHVSCILIIFCISFILFSCGKENPYLYLSQSFKDISVFRKNSYWIYVNDSTLLEDSCYVQNDPIVYFSDNHGWNEETIQVLVKSSFFETYNLRHQCSSVTPNHIDEQTERLSLFIKESNGLKGLVFAIWHGGPLNENNPDPCSCSPSFCAYFKSEYLPELMIGDNKFQNVLHTNYHSSDTSETSSNFYSYHFYFVKHIGLIRFQENNNMQKSYRSFSLYKWDVYQ